MVTKLAKHKTLHHSDVTSYHVAWLWCQISWDGMLLPQTEILNASFTRLFYSSLKDYLVRSFELSVFIEIDGQA